VASIHPEDKKSTMGNPYVADYESWKDMITEDVSQMGMQHAASILQIPHDTAMARRDHGTMLLAVA
jgi:hypothetical protein